MKRINPRKDSGDVEQRNKTTGRILKELADTEVKSGINSFIGGISPKKSGNMSGNAGYIGSTLRALEPVLYINFPNAKTPTYGPIINNVRRNALYGYPCNMVSNSSLIGEEEQYFAQFKNVKLTFTAYDEVLQEITNLLETGVYL